MAQALPWHAKWPLHMIMDWTQLPCPLHSIWVATPFMHVLAPHASPLGYFWQPPLPSQSPFVPQVEAAWAWHCEGGAGWTPAATGAQVPPAHVMHVPLQAELQQNPCTQKVDWHSL